MVNLLKKKWISRLLIVIISLAVIFTILQVIPPKKVMNNNPFLKKEDGSVLIAAHRGGRGLNPENTIKAFDHAILSYDLDVLEFDLVMTKDGHLVSIHDNTLNRTSDVEEITKESKPHYVRDYTLDELLEFNMGYKFKDKNGLFPYKDLVSFDDSSRRQILKDNNLSIATIEEIFDRYKDLDILYIIEIKDEGQTGKNAADKLNTLLTAYDLFDKVTIGSFHDEISNYLRTTYPNIIRGGSVGDVTGFIITQMLGVNIFDFNYFASLQIPTDQNAGPIKLKLDRKTYINRAHRRGMSVQYWTINDKEEMHRLIDLGADVIMTDYPDVLYELLVELGYK